MIIRLNTWKNRDCTLGRLSIDGNSFKCFTLELPWDGNKPNVSCVPEGTYELELYNSPKRGEVLQLKAVAGRSNIQIHEGNYTRQIQGCILPGDAIKYIDGDTIPDVANSSATNKALMAVVKPVLVKGAKVQIIISRV